MPLGSAPGVAIPSKGVLLYEGAACPSGYTSLGRWKPLLDLMEYATDAAAQAAYVSSDPEAIAKNFESGGDVDQPVGDVTGIEAWRASKFILSGAITCTAASIYIHTKNGSPTGDMTFRIETDSSGKPSGTLAHANATGTIANGDIATAAWNKRSFTPFSLAAGTYWLVIYIPDQANDVYWTWLTDNNGAGIAAYSTDHGDNWTVTDPRAYYYRIYGICLQSYSESSTKQEGSYSLKGFAKATDSLNDTLTRTVSPTIDLSNVPRIKFGIYASRTGSNIKIGIHDSGGTTTETTPNITVADTWQTATLDLSSVANSDKDAIDQIIITIVNADADNTFYIDWMSPRVLFCQKD